MDAGLDGGLEPADGGTDAGFDAGVEEDGGFDAGTTFDAGFDAGTTFDAGFDAGTTFDAGFDAGVPEDAGLDAGTTIDAGFDAGLPEDAGFDAGLPEDAGFDAGLPEDAGFDAGTLDAGWDAGLPEDAGVDAGTFDAGFDAGGIDGGFDAGVTPDGGSDAGLGVDAGFASDAGSADAGTCVWYQSCTPSNPCHKGHWICPPTGAECRQEDALLSDSSACGNNSVCYLGECLTCGTSCEPNHFSCQEATVSCTDPRVCVPRGGTRPDLSTCDMGYLICIDGTCQGCTDYVQCTPANHCHTGYLTCTGGAACNDTNQAGPDGVSCENDGVCHLGACAPMPYHLTIVSGDNQHAYVDQALASPVVVKLTDANGVALPDATLAITAPEGAVATPLTVTTGSDGKATFTLRLNRLLGATLFPVVGPTGVEVDIQATADAPPDGFVFGVVNDEETGSNDPPGPGTITHMDSPAGIAVASDGTLYLSDSWACRVVRLSPAGALTDVVGSTSTWCGFSGDNGPAIAAQLSRPGALVLDDTETQLFIADKGNQRIRKVDLLTGVITTYAGGGSAIDVPWGDGGLATDAVLAGPVWVGWSPISNGAHVLVIADSEHWSLRYVDAAGIINSLELPQGTGDCSVDSLDVKYFPQGTSVVWDPHGGAYLSAYICGQQAGSQYDSDITPGVVRIEANGSISLVAGNSHGSTEDGIPSVTAKLDDTPNLALDPGGNLLLTMGYGNRIRRIDGTSGTITTIGGTTTAGNLGRYVPATSARFNAPSAAVLGPDLNLYIADTGNVAVRTIWHAGSATPSDVELSDATTYPLGTVWVDDELPLFKAHLTAAGVPVPGATIHWKSLDDGAGLRATTSLTGADGSATPSGRVGRAPNRAYRFQASYTNLRGDPVPGSPVTFSVTPTLPASGTVYTLLNVDHVQYGEHHIPGPGTLSRPGGGSGLAIASDGTLYQSVGCAVVALSPEGLATIIAGQSVDYGTCGFSGDGGPANAAQLSARGLALDEAHHRLFIADSQNNRIRVMDLQTGLIDTFAGAEPTSCSSDMDCSGLASASHCSNGGTCVTCTTHEQCGSGHFCYLGACAVSQSNAMFEITGDGGAAADAVLPSPFVIAYGNGGLFVSGSNVYGASYLRFIDSNGIISTIPIPFGNNVTGTGCVRWNPIAVNSIGSLAWDPNIGTLYLSAGFICGGMEDCGTFGGIASYTPALGALAWVGGQNLGCGGVSTDGVSMQSVYFGGGPYLAVDSAGDLYMATANERRIRRTAGAVMGSCELSGDSLVNGSPRSSCTFAVDAEFAACTCSYSTADSVLAAGCTQSGGTVTVLGPPFYVAGAQQNANDERTIGGSRYQALNGGQNGGTLDGTQRDAMIVDGEVIWMYVGTGQPAHVSGVCYSTIETFAGKYGQADSSGDYGPVSDVHMTGPAEMAFGSDGAFVFTDFNGYTRYVQP